ncbi:2377_t:CDS:1, partial [Ambispora gerdemannii]
ELVEDDDNEKTHTAEAERVEGASGEAIKIGRIDFNAFDFSQVKKEIMSIDPEKYPDAYC